MASSQKQPSSTPYHNLGHEFSPHNENQRDPLVVPDSCDENSQSEEEANSAKRRKIGVVDAKPAEKKSDSLDQKKENKSSSNVVVVAAAAAPHVKEKRHRKKEEKQSEDPQKKKKKKKKKKKSEVQTEKETNPETAVADPIQGPANAADAVVDAPPKHKVKKESIKTNETKRSLSAPADDELKEGDMNIVEETLVEYLLSQSVDWNWLDDDQKYHLKRMWKEVKTVEYTFLRMKSEYDAELHTLAFNAYSSSQL